jgi:hypothetical protein
LPLVDDFLWRHFKDEIYVSNARNIAELDGNVREEIESILKGMTRRVMGNLHSRVQ